jgi:hypothetical protein
MEQGMTEESDKLDFLDETAEAAPEPETEPAQVEATGEPEAAPPTATEEKPQTIPITALLDEREKRQEAMRQAEEARKELEAMRRQIAAAQQPQKRPDWFEKPDEAIRYAVAPLKAQMLNDRLDTSEMLAEDKYGAETVTAAKQAFLEAAQQDPGLHHRVLQSRHPYDEVVKWHKRQSVMSQIGDDPEAWIEQQVKARLEQMQSPSSPAPVNRPPVSLAAAPAAGRAAPQAKGSGFDQAFPV